MDLVVPELQKRGLMRDYAAPGGGGVFGENVLGRKGLADDLMNRGSNGE